MDTLSFEDPNPIRNRGYWRFVSLKKSLLRRKYGLLHGNNPNGGRD
jgi:hypothetical protein